MTHTHEHDYYMTQRANPREVKAVPKGTTDIDTDDQGATWRSISKGYALDLAFDRNGLEPARVLHPCEMCEGDIWQTFAKAWPYSIIARKLNDEPTPDPRTNPRNLCTCGCHACQHGLHCHSTNCFTP